MLAFLYIPKIVTVAQQWLRGRPFGHNKHGRKIGGYAAFEREELRGDWVSIRIPIAYPQKNQWESPQNPQTHRTTKSSIPMPHTRVFSSDTCFAVGMYSTAWCLKIIIMAANYIFALLFLLPSFFFFISFFLACSQPSKIGCLPYFHTWSGLSANLGCKSEMCCTQLAENTGRKSRQKSPSAALRTIAQLCRAISCN